MSEETRQPEPSEESESAFDGSTGPSAGDADAPSDGDAGEGSGDGKIKSGKLAGKSLPAAIWILAMPILMQQTMQACVGLADKMFAGHLPESIRVPALDGVGVASYIGWFIGIAMAGLGIGAQALIARGIGGGHRKQAHHALGQGITLSILWGVLVGVVLFLSPGALTAITNLGETASPYLKQYIWTLSASIPFAALMMVGSMCLHGAGETVKPSFIAISVAILNIIFSWIFSGVELTFGEFVIENPFTFNLDVVGIAMGTAMAYVVGAAMTLIVLLKGVKDLRLEPSEMRIDRPMIWRIVRIGVPSFMEGISMWAVNLLVLNMIGMIGTEGLQGAHSIAVQWEAFSFMPGFAIGTAAGALAGQYLGAGNPRMATRAIMWCTAVAIVLMSLLGVVFILCGEWLTSVISREPIHLKESPPLLIVCGFIQVFFAITMVVRQGLRGVGDTKWTLVITTVSSYGVRLPAAYFFGIVLEMGLLGIWIGMSGEIVVRACLFFARFKHGGWKRVRV